MKRSLRGKAPVLLVLAFTAAACVEEREFQPFQPAPSVPQLRLPRNDEYVGSTVLGRLQPKFVWEAATVSKGEVRYELQYSPNVTFPEGAESGQTVSTASTSFTPAEALPVNTTPPVGRRYYWRVRACAGESCSEYSKPRWVNLGRSSKDFNGDGYDDVVVGAHAPPVSGHEMGRAYVYFGGPGTTLDGTPDGTFSDGVAGSRAGMSVSSAGDFNGDGFADVLIGAPARAVSGQINAGMAYLLLGAPGTSFDVVADVSFTGRVANASLGSSVSAAGDFDGDAYSDVIVAALGDPESSAILYFGSADPRAAAPRTLNLRTSRDAAFGTSVAGAGDFNGDGYADVVVNAASVSFADSAEVCRSEVYFGGATPDGVTDLKVGGSPGEKCSLESVHAGDVNGDGFSDVVGRVTSRGAGLKLFLGAAASTGLSDTVLALNSRRLCRDVAAVGDVNGDGAADIALAEYETSVGATVGVYLGRTGAASAALVEVPAGEFLSPSSTYGYSISGSDVNGDGFDDLLIGDQSADAAGGRVNMFLGNSGASLNTGVDAALTNGDAFGFFGFSLD